MSLYLLNQLVFKGRVHDFWCLETKIQKNFNNFFTDFRPFLDYIFLSTFWLLLACKIFSTIGPASLTVIFQIGIKNPKMAICRSKTIFEIFLYFCVQNSELHDIYSTSKTCTLPLRESSPNFLLAYLMPLSMTLFGLKTVMWLIASFQSYWSSKSAQSVSNTCQTPVKYVLDKLWTLIER